MKPNEPSPICDRCKKPVKSWSNLLCDTCKGVVERVAEQSPTLDEFAKRAGEKGKESK